MRITRPDLFEKLVQQVRDEKSLRVKYPTKSQAERGRRKFYSWRSSVKAGQMPLGSGLSVDDLYSVRATVGEPNNGTVPLLFYFYLSPLEEALDDE